MLAQITIVVTMVVLPFLAVGRNHRLLSRSARHAKGLF